MPNGAKLVAKYKQSGQQVENVFYFVGTSAWTATSLGALGIAFENWETTNLAPLRNDSTAYHGLEVIDAAVVDGTIVFSTAEIDGHVASEPLPNNCSLAIKANTGFAGRSNRGRTFWIGLCEAQRDGADHNAVSGAFSASLLTAMNQILITALPNSAHMVVASFRHDNAWRLTATARQVTSYSLTDLTIDSQRRRLPGHNVHR